jgi:hypothetical protein
MGYSGNAVTHFSFITIKKIITMKFKDWVVELFKDERGSTSIKPVVAFIGSMFLCVTMTINSFSHEQFKPADSLVDAVMIITAIGLGADSLDKFSKKKVESTNEETPVE